MIGRSSWAAWLACLPVALHAATYQVTEIVDMPSTGSWGPPVINRHGDVAATVDMGDGARAIFVRDGNVEVLGTFGGATLARGINDRGHVVGDSDTDVNAWRFHAFVWKGRGMKDLGDFDGAQTVVATGINENGQVVGWWHGQLRNHAFVWHQGTTTELPTLGGNHAYANGINRQGWVTGLSTLSDGHYHAFLFDGSAMQDLGALPGETASSGTAINDAGVVAGRSGARATLFKDGQVIDLGTLGGDESEALAINRAGDVVGWSKSAPDGKANGDHTKAFLYRDGRMISLIHRLDPITGAGWKLNGASGINDAGQIVGWGERDGLPRLFLLTPMR